MTTIYAVIYDRDTGNDYGDTETQYDPDEFYASREGAQKQCDALNDRVIEQANKHAQWRYDESLKSYQKNKVLHDAGLQNWMPREPAKPVPFSLENLPPESYYIEEIELKP